MKRTVRSIVCNGRKSILQHLWKRSLVRREPMYAGISDSVLTNLSRTQILSLALTGISCGFSEESLQVVPGEQVMGDYYEEFHVDEEQFYEMILDLFYIGEDS